LLVGAFFMLLLAGPSRLPTARRWDGTVVAWSRLFLLVALASGVAWMVERTAVFENRPLAALEPRAVWHAILDTRPGLIWLGRHSLLIWLGAFLAMRADLSDTRNWIAARAEPLLLATLALVLTSGSSHAGALTSGTVQAVAFDVSHLLATGIWAGALLPLA